jgi:hypothetical protein
MRLRVLIGLFMMLLRNLREREFDDFTACDLSLIFVVWNGYSLEMHTS